MKQKNFLFLEVDDLRVKEKQNIQIIEDLTVKDKQNLQTIEELKAQLLSAQLQIAQLKEKGLYCLY